MIWRYHMQKKNRVNILGVPVDMVDKEQASAVFAEIFSAAGVQYDRNAEFGDRSECF